MKKHKKSFFIVIVLATALTILFIGIPAYYIYPRVSQGWSAILFITGLGLYFIVCPWLSMKLKLFT